MGLVDVDLVTRYNDHNGHNGHPAGDECVRRVAAVMTASLKRPIDMVDRYGGEEFGLLLPDIDAAGALHPAGQIREGPRLAHMDHAESSGGPLLTISVGLCTWVPGVVGGTAALLAAADAQLCLAKSRGCYQACGALLSGD